MASLNDPEYFARRESQERLLAEQCGDPVIAAIHMEMAERYAERTRTLAAEPIQPRRQLRVAYGSR